MTQEAKHALIAKFEGFTVIDVPIIPRDHRPFSGTNRFTRSAYEAMHQTYPKALAGAWPQVENYASDNAPRSLLGRVEAKVAANIEWSGRFLTALTEAMPRDFMPWEPYSFSTRWWVMTAPASARVDALVALIQSMEPKP